MYNYIAIDRDSHEQIGFNSFQEALDFICYGIIEDYITGDIYSIACHEVVGEL